MAVYFVPKHSPDYRMELLYERIKNADRAVEQIYCTQKICAHNDYYLTK